MGEPFRFTHCLAYGRMTASFCNRIIRGYLLLRVQKAEALPKDEKVHSESPKNSFAVL
jgi:hypothetical protein